MMDHSFPGNSFYASTTFLGGDRCQHSSSIGFLHGSVFRCITVSGDVMRFLRGE